MVPEIVKQISTQFKQFKSEGSRINSQTDRQMCKAQDSSHMSQATYKTKRLAHHKQSSSIKFV
jgi:hypothetical protein